MKLKFLSRIQDLAARAETLSPRLERSGSVLLKTLNESSRVQRLGRFYLQVEDSAW